MPEESMMIQVLEGPDRGSRLTVPADVGKKAIKDRWARDAFAPASEEEVEPPTQEEREKIIAAAVKAGRKLRGEPDDDAEPEAEDDEPESRDMAPEEPAEYETRDVAPRRGRPRKS